MNGPWHSIGGLLFAGLALVYNPLTHTPGPATEASPLEGLWAGTVGQSQVAIQIARPDRSQREAWEATLYDLSNDTAAVPSMQTTVTELSVVLEFPGLAARLEGSLRADKDVLEARWLQGAQDLSVPLKRSDPIPSITERKRWTELGMHPIAPLATGQFAFLIGEWHGKNPKRPNTTLVWKGEWIFDGMGIQNTSKTTGDAGTPKEGAIYQWGIDTRVFSRSRGVWQHSYVSALKGDVMTTTWTLQGDALVSGIAVWNEGGQPTTNIIKFRNISDDHFTWSFDRTLDGGETWVEDFMVIENVRVEG